MTGTPFSRDGSKVDILQLVHSWLCSMESGNWVMILDNADDKNVCLREKEVRLEPKGISGVKHSENSSHVK